jgi:predicted AAA+ superfamily ATPase
MFESVIIEQNLHWAGELYDQGVGRSYFPKLLEYLSTGMVVSIIGVRRAGKSTLLKQTINHLVGQKKIPPKNILFLNLEHPYFSSFNKDVEYLQKIYEDYLKVANPSGKIYILLDEVQFFQDWPVFVKSLYEQKKIQFILTGSNSTLLSSDLMTLLSGRTLTLEIFPFSFEEIAKANNIEVNDPIQISKHRPQLRNLLDQFLKYGGFPGVAFPLIPSVAYDILNAYAKTILYQDVAPRLQLRKSVELERLFVYLISNIGKPFSYSNLSDLFDLTDKVIKEYIGAFSDSYLLFELEMFDFSLKKQIRNPKKIYSIDTGQVNAVAFHFTENLGRLLENLVFLELRRSGLELYYYKTQNNLEVDFLAKKHTHMALIQVALNVINSKTLTRELNALLQGLNELKLNHGIVITQDHEELLVTDNKNITVIPAYKFFCLTSDEKMKLLQLG